MHAENSTVVQIIRGDTMDVLFKGIAIVLMVFYFLNGLSESKWQYRVISGSIGVAIAATYIAARLLL